MSKFSRAATRAIAGVGLSCLLLTGAGSGSSVSAAAALGGTGYAALTPARLLDTRPGSVTIDGQFAGGGAVGAGQTLDVKVTGRGGVPDEGVGAVVLNIVTVEQTEPTFMTVFPKGSPRPEASNLNPFPNVIQPNLVIAKVGDGGVVSIYNHLGSVHVVADVQGWFPSPLGDAYAPLVPARLLETRSGFSTIDGESNGVGALEAGETLDLTVVGRGGVPASGVAAVVVNITATNATQPTFLTVFPTGTTRPLASNLNPRPGLTSPNAAIVNVGADGKISIYNEVGSVDVIVDVQGWFPEGVTFNATDPIRLLDSREGLPAAATLTQAASPLGPNSTLDLRIVGGAGVPVSGVGTVVLNVTATDATEPTFLTIYPTGTTRPLASNLNPVPGSTAPNLVMVKVGAGGSISIYNLAGEVNVIVDLFGWLPSDTVAGDDTLTIDEDATATPIDVLANDVDNDGGPVTIASVTQPANGTATLTGGSEGARIGVSYAPDADFCGTDTLDYTLNGGVSATVTVTVTCVDDPPVAVSDAAAATEDGPAVAIDVLANDTDVDGGPKSVQSIAQPSNGSSAITGGGSGVSYSPAPDFCGADTFTYTLNGGAAATVTVDVSCVNDGPSIATSAGVTAYTENGAPVPVEPALTVTDDGDIAGATVQITGNLQSVQDVLGFTAQSGISSAYDAATGTLTLTGSAPAAGYQTALRSVTYANTSDTPSTATRTVTFQVTDDGALASSTAGRDVSVTATNDAPVVTTTAGATPYTEGDPATIVDGGVTVTDPDDTNLESATVRFSAGFQSGDQLVFVNTATVTGTYNTGTGVLTLNGTATIADYQAALRSIPFVTTSDDPMTTKTVELVVNDGDSESAPATKTISVTPVDDLPVAVDDSATVGEDSGASPIDVLANDTDPDGGPKTIESVTQPASGTVVITGDGTGLTYEPGPDYCNVPPGTTLDTFTYTLNGGATGTVSVTVTCVDDPPTAVDDTASVFQNSAANAIDVLANDTDIDGGPKVIVSATDPAHGTVVLTGGSPGAHTGLTYQPDPTYCDDGPPDTFLYTLNGGSSATVSITVSCDVPPVAVDDSATVAEDSSATSIDVLANDTDVDGGPKTIGSVTQPGNGAVVITGGGTGLTYEPGTNYCNTPPGTTPDTFTYTLNGGATATVSVSVTCVDDAPTAVDDSTTVLEDAAATAVGVLANDPDIDGGPMSIQAVTQPANGTAVITGGGTGLTYQPNANYCNNPPGTTPDTFTYTLNGGSSATVSVSVTCVNDPPTANADSFDTIGNTELRVDLTPTSTPAVAEATATLNGVRGNDADTLEGDPFTVTSIVGCVDTTAPYDCAVAGGSVSMTADGDFSFVPSTTLPSGTPTDTTFQYVVTDEPVVGTPASATGSVTIHVFDKVWYVRQGETGSGTSTSPLGDFTTIATAGPDVDAPGDYIFVYNSAPLNSSIVLEGSQHLLGEGVGLSINRNLNGNGAPTNLVAAGARPQLTSAATTVSATDAMPAEIRGLSLASSGGNPIDVTTATILSGSPSLTISSNTFTGAGAEGIDVNLNVGTTGTLGLSITDNTWTGVASAHAGTAVDIQRQAGNLNLAFSNNTNIVSNAGALVVSGGNAVTVTGFSNNSVNGDTAGAGVALSNVIFDATPGGAVQPVAGGTLAVGAAANPVGQGALAIVTSAGSVAFDDLDLFSSTGTALNVTGAGPASALTFNVAPIAPAGSGTSTILAQNGPALVLTQVTVDLRLADLDSTTTTSAVNLNTVLGQVSAPTGSTISKTSGGGGPAFSVAGSNAAVNYGGTINVSSGSGVSLTTNAGTTSFTGQMTLNTGGSAAFSATGGGTVTVTGTTNTLTTTTATALNVQNTTIGAADLTFRSISSSGAANGIVLANTGAVGGLAITGNGGTCSSAADCTGGEIQNSGGSGVSLTNVGGGVSLTRLAVTGSADDGIAGTSVVGFTLANSVVLNNGNAVADRGIDLFDLTGSGGISSSTISGSSESNVRIENNTSSALSAFNVTGSTISTTNFVTGDDGFLALNDGAGAMNVSVTGSTFTDNKGDHFQAASDADASGTMDITFDGNTLTTTAANDPNVIGGGITINTSGTLDITFRVRNNNIQQAFDDAINLNLDPGSLAGATFVGTVSGNTIGTTGVADSGSESSNTITFAAKGAGTATVAITGNNVRQFGNGMGIFVGATEGSPVVNATVTGNTVKEPGTFALNGIRVDAGATAGPPADASTLCINISGNDATGSAKSPPTDTDIRFRQRFNTTIRLPGYSGANSDTAAVNTFVAANNTGSPTVSSIHNVGGGGGGYVGGAACTTPPP